MTVFFTSDTHFGDAGVRRFYHRPFPSAAAMDAAMIANWNATVGPGDEVWHLGDFAVGHPAPAAVLGALHGRKHLITGNNDPPEVAALAGWASVQPFHELELEGRHVVLCHYALRTWDDMGKGAVNLHGHSHGRLKPLTRQFDVGVDVRGFRPVTLAELLGARLPRRQPALGETGAGP